MSLNKYVTDMYSNINTYVYLHNAADWAIDQAKGTEKGRVYNCMSANLLLAFCLEAYLNHICEELLPFWDENMKKNLNTENKLKIISSHLNLDLNYSKRPYHTLKDVWKFRNLVVHGKREKIRTQTVRNMRKEPFQGDALPERAKPWWEQQYKIKVSEKWFMDIETVIKSLHGKYSSEPSPFLIVSTHTFSSTPL